MKKAGTSSKVIRVDLEVWEKLKRLAVPLEDTPGDVIRRLVGLAPRGPAPSPVGWPKAARSQVSKRALSRGLLRARRGDHG